MGAAAPELADNELAIHGTNNPGSIGGLVSAGCVRMPNKGIIMSGSVHKPPIRGSDWAAAIHPLCLSCTSCTRAQMLSFMSINRGNVMKKVALALVLVVAGLSLGGCFVGKGKAPAPVVTKG